MILKNQKEIQIKDWEIDYSLFDGQMPCSVSYFLGGFAVKTTCQIMGGGLTFSLTIIAGHIFLTCSLTTLTDTVHNTTK